MFLLLLAILQHRVDGADFHDESQSCGTAALYNARQEKCFHM